MERDEILAKSRAENKNRDVYEKLKQANSYVLALSGCHVYYLVAMG